MKWIKILLILFLLPSMAYANLRSYHYLDAVNKEYNDFQDLFGRYETGGKYFKRGIYKAKFNMNLGYKHYLPVLERLYLTKQIELSGTYHLNNIVGGFGILNYEVNERVFEGSKDQYLLGPVVDFAGLYDSKRTLNLVMDWVGIEMIITFLLAR